MATRVRNLLRALAPFGLAAAVALLALAAPPADAGPMPKRIEVAPGYALAARCPPGFRRHTITAKCVRRQPRFPLLSWF